MLEFLNDLRESNKDDEKVLKAINEIESELNNKKYGLVWEEHEEEVDRMLKSNIPVFSEVHDKEIKEVEDDGFNFLLEGDNLHSLKLLEKTHKGKVDVIYIDPPYNTGNKDFVYSDALVGDDDSFRHSKWLSFINKRIRIARELLSQEGVIFISIDDNEESNLKLLCDEVFGEKNYIGCLPRVTKKSGKDHSEGIAKNHDYVLIFVKDISSAEFKGISSKEDEYPLKDEFFEERGGYKLNQTLDYDSLWYNPKMDFALEVDGRVFYPGGEEEKHIERQKGNHKSKDWVWRWSKAKFDFGLRNGFVEIKKGKGRDRIYTKTYAKATISSKQPYVVESKKRETKLSSLAMTDNIMSNDNAKKEITNVGLEEFGFPKPSTLIKQLISICEKQSLILDFFAGSGTTAQAVLELNKEDGGNRKFILCTNNENNICEDITYQRIKTVITGKRKDGSEYSEGIPANLKYYKTDFVSKDEEYLTDDLNEHIKEMVQLELGVDIDDSNYCLVLSDDDADELEEKIDEMKDLKGIYVSKDVLLTSSQKTKFKDLEKHVIPDCYYDLELKENGE